MSFEFALASTDLVFSESTCFIIGAGASFDCIDSDVECLPLTKDLFATWMSTGGFFEREFSGFQTIKDLTKAQLIAGLQHDLEGTIDKLRELTTDTDSEIAIGAADALRRLTRMVVMSISLHQTIAFITADNPDEEGILPLDEEMGPGHGFRAKNYMWLALVTSQMPKTSILSLNYDTLLDNAYSILKFAGGNSGLPVPKQFSHWVNMIGDICNGKPTKPYDDEGVYLKLHGTLHMYACQNLECSNYRVPFLRDDHPVDQIGISVILNDPKLKCPKCGGEALDAIIPPGKNKTASESRYHEAVYTTAGRALENSDNWTLLGYSCPNYDKDVVDLLSEALAYRKREGYSIHIQIISPDAMNVAERLGKRLKYPVKAFSIGFSLLRRAAGSVGKYHREHP